MSKKKNETKEKFCAACGCKESENFTPDGELAPLRYNAQRAEYVCLQCPLDPSEE